MGWNRPYSNVFSTTEMLYIYKVSKGKLHTGESCRVCLTLTTFELCALTGSSVQNRHQLEVFCLFLNIKVRFI